jgi:hypothetical protein
VFINTSLDFIKRLISDQDLPVFWSKIQISIRSNDIKSVDLLELSRNRILDLPNRISVSPARTGANDGRILLTDSIRSTSGGSIMYSGSETLRSSLGASHAMPYPAVLEAQFSD